MSEIKIDDICVGSVSKFAGEALDCLLDTQAATGRRKHARVRNPQGGQRLVGSGNNLKELKGSNSEDGNY